jgi:hypothetical protein
MSEDSPTPGRSDAEILAHDPDIQLLRDVASGNVVALRGNYGSAIMVMPLLTLVGEAAHSRHGQLAQEGLVWAPVCGPPSTTPRGLRLLLRAKYSCADT